MQSTYVQCVNTAGCTVTTSSRYLQSECEFPTNVCLPVTQVEQSHDGEHYHREHGGVIPEEGG